MNGKSNILAVVMVAVLAFAPQTAAIADSLRVSPINLSLGTSGTGILNAENQGKQPIAAQVEAFDWQQSDGKDVLTPSNALQLSPPIIRLAPGQKQIVRVRITAIAAGTRERA